MVVSLDYSVIYVLICFLIIFWMAKRFLLDSLNRIIEERHGLIESAREQAESLDAEIRDALAEYEKRISSARGEGFAVRQSLKEAAAGKQRKLIDKAREEAAKRVAAAQADLESIVEESKRHLRAESEEMAEGIAAAVMWGGGSR